MARDHLGEFEHIVLLAVLRLGDDAYGVPIRRDITLRTRRELTVGSLYSTLDRLESKGLFRSRTGDPTLIAGLSGSLSGLGLVLASIGVYGVGSYAVSKRLREIGIRMALGASAVEVRSMILKQSMRPVFAGVAVGLLLAAGVARILQSVLFGVSAYDPVAFVGAPFFLITVAVTASMVPIRRAMNVDPMT